MRRRLCKTLSLRFEKQHMRRLLRDMFPKVVVLRARRDVELRRVIRRFSQFQNFTRMLTWGPFDCRYYLEVFWSRRMLVNTDTLNDACVLARITGGRL